MGTVIQLNDADFSNQGFPNIFPYIRKEELSYAYDFRHGNFSDLVTGESVKGWLSDLTAKTTVSKTPQEVTQLSSNGLFIRLAKNAALSTQKLIRNYTIGASRFTAISICGLPSNSEGSGSLPSFLDMGNGSGSLAGIPSIEASGLNIGIRAKPQFNLDISTSVNLGQLYFVALVFDGANFVYVNKTTGYSESKSLSSLGITEMTATLADVDPGKHCFGCNINKTSIHENAILLGQSAFWDNISLSFPEIDQQYALMKQIYGSLI
ncbi:hypothetical protein IC766_14285 [Acinetobacter seifertii]|uniref:hypothetical protein n=1 Tax=Acinetobacter seifertii TaxID=1530123 RepID=UPI00168A5DD9|nr:hypothetical protein [Acinetobacter seifertii]QNY13269.1 hypothetical protein IC766_14285 [Acinetobacter seifertii]